MEAVLSYQKNTNTSLIKKRIQDYWSERSETFAGQRRHELKDDIAFLWMAEIEKYIPADRTLKVLDVGTGSGFFAILLARIGHQVTGIDLTPSMIEEAKKLAAEQQAKVDFRVMDAENPEFAEETFDLVISRNLTWTLPHVEEAYYQWYRVLKKGGLLLNFDADYGKEKTADYSKLPDNHAHKQICDRLLQENDAIKAELNISRFTRPTWDVHTLLNIGMEEIQIDAGVSRRVYKKKDEFYNPTPLFCICARK